MRQRDTHEAQKAGVFRADPSDSKVMLEGMSVGLTPTQADVFTTTAFCDGRVAPDSIYGLLHRECFVLSRMRCSPICFAIRSGARSRR
jgi:hypothetical protein